MCVVISLLQMSFWPVYRTAFITAVSKVRRQPFLDVISRRCRPPTIYSTVGLLYSPSQRILDFKDLQTRAYMWRPSEDPPTHTHTHTLRQAISGKATLK